MKQHIPNILTMSNLFCGCCAIVCLLVEKDAYLHVVMFFALGFLFDALDGRMARHFGVSGPMGKELDSLADMVTFGVLPGAIMFSLLSKSFYFGDYAAYFGINNNHGGSAVNLWALPAFLISVFAGLRLAKYNLDTRQSDTFIGLPTPANTTFVIGLLAICFNNSMGLGDYLYNPFALFAIILLLSYLQIAEIPMLNFRFKNYGFVGNESRYVLVAISLASLILFKEAAPAIIIFFYVMMSVLNNLLITKEV